MDRAEGLAFFITWRVTIFLPSDERGASQWIDAHVDGLIDALEPVGFIDRIEPVTLPAGGSEQYALSVTMRGE
jgi:hypothetical protein